MILDSLGIGDMRTGLGNKRNWFILKKNEKLVENA
jgi:hypothetical protein